MFMMCSWLLLVCDCIVSKVNNKLFKVSVHTLSHSIIRFKLVYKKTTVPRHWFLNTAAQKHIMSKPSHLSAFHA